MKSQFWNFCNRKSYLLPAFIMLGFITGCGETPTEEVSKTITQRLQNMVPRPDLGEIITVQSSNLPSTVNLAGTVVPRHVVTLSVKSQGRVTYLAGPVGTRFYPQQVLLEVDSNLLEAQHRAAWANLAEASAALQDANVQLYRRVYAPDPGPQGGMGMMQMFDRFFTRPASNFIGTSNTGVERYAEFNQSRVAVERAQATVMRAQSQVDEIEYLLDETIIRGPGHGVILEKFVERGNIVQPGQPLLTVADTDDLLIKVDVPNRVVFGLHRGMPVEVNLDALDVPLKTVVERIFPAADAFRHTVTVELSVPFGAPVAPGMYATVEVPDQTKQTAALPVVPESALLWRGSQPGVFVINYNQKAELRLLRLGQKIPEGVVVLSGLKAGDRILASPPADLRSESGNLAMSR